MCRVPMIPARDINKILLFLTILSQPKKSRLHIKKKAWEPVPLPVPRLEAFALPSQSRTSNAEAHADTIYMPRNRVHHDMLMHATRDTFYISRKHLPLPWFPINL